MISFSFLTRAARGIAAILALAVMTLPAAASAQSRADYVGVWSGSTDWRGIDGYDNPNATWNFRADGTFVDDFNAPGNWQVNNQGYIVFQYAREGGSTYTGIIVGNLLLGTMTNGEVHGVFALTR